MRNNYLFLRSRILFLVIKRRKLTVKKIFNALYCYTAYFLRLKKSAASPYLINFELGNECNERCVFCRTSDGEVYDANPNSAGQYISKGTMLFEIFAGIISQVRDRLIMAVPYVNGEPLLSKDIYQVIQYATDNKVATMVATNGILLNEFNCEKLLVAGIDFIKVHISGFTRPIHYNGREKLDHF
jgi:MoaA/NifB/PqqE/SkfB family radical SAM enzyme